MRRVHMRFERVFDSWRVSFAVLDGSEKLRELTFADGGKVEQLAQRAGALNDLAAKHAIETALRKGLGGVELRLTGDQFAKLKR